MAITSDSTIQLILNALDADMLYLGIGTGAVPVASATALPSEAERKLATSLIDGNTLIKEGFWDTDEANGVTYTNAATFGDGATASVGTGSYRVAGLISATKDSDQSLTVSIETTVEAV